MQESPQEVRAFFDAHWTVRKYKKFEMPLEHLDVILSAAQRAPTDATAQMYSFIRMIDESVRSQVAQMAGNPHIATASESFVICADLYRLKRVVEEAGVEFGKFPHIGIHFGIGDAVMAGQNMLIAAEMLGYRGCWIGGVLNNLDKISDLLKLPEGVIPFAGLTLGLPDEEPQYRPRVERALAIHENYYRIPNQEDLGRSIQAMAKITQRGNWAQTLAGYFGKGGGMETREPLMKDFLKRKLKL